MAETLITKPTLRHYTDRKTVQLVFGRQDHPLNGEYHMRGGICFPVPVRFGADLGAAGFVLLAGQNVETGVIYVFEERPFLTIDHVIGVEDKIEFEGCCQWFNECWSYYYGRDYYWHQDPETRKTYLLELVRSKMVEPRPHLLEIDWRDDYGIEHLIWRMGNTGKLKFKADGELHDALRLLEVQSDRSMLIPGVHALKCCLAGFTRYPHRKKS